MRGYDKKSMVKIWVWIAILVIFLVAVVWADAAHAAPAYRGAEHGNGKQPEHAKAGGRDGKVNNDPDDDGNGPDRGDGTVDDWDWNNGCGNDPDRADDNEGWCGRPKPVEPVEPVEVVKPVGRVCKLVLYGSTPEVFDASLDVRNPASEAFVIAESHDYLEITLPWGFRGKVLWWTEELGHSGHVTGFICAVEELAFFEPTWAVSEFE